MDSYVKNRLSKKITLEEEVWFDEFLFQLENNKGFYIKKNFEKWENQVKEKLKQIKRTNWTIETLAAQISS